MKRSVPMRWIAGLALALAASISQAQEASPFQARLAAWQNPSRLVRQQTSAPSTAELPPPNARPAPAAMPRGPVQSAPMGAGQGMMYESSGDMPGELVTEGMHESSAAMLGYDQYEPGYADGYGGGCGPNCGPTCGPGCGLFGGPGIFGHGLLGGRCGDMCGPMGGQGCGPVCGSGCLGCDQCCDPSLWWVDVDFTFGWRRGKGYPALVTGSPDGVLPQSEILYKNGQETSQMAPGMRIDVGTWIDHCQVFGIGGKFWFLGKDSGSFDVNSDQSPVIGRPFYDIDSDQQDALLVAFPGLRSGDLSISSSNDVFGGDAYGRLMLMKTCYGRIDAIGGYQFSRINDDFHIASNTTALANDGNIVAGTTFRIVDLFNTRNEFHGGSLGLQWERECCGWTLNVLGKVGLGNMRQTAVVNGQSTITVPGQNPVVEQGGLLTASTNISQQARDEFCAVPELNLALSYQIRPCLNLSIGYSFMYWSDVLRPGDIIDTTIDTNSTFSTRPTLVFNSSDFWVQGLNLGLHYDF